MVFIRPEVEKYFPKTRNYLIVKTNSVSKTLTGWRETAKKVAKMAANGIQLDKISKKLNLKPDTVTKMLQFVGIKKSKKSSRRPVPLT